MLNKTIISGRFTDTPELRYTTTGVAVSTFTLAVRRDYKKDGKEITDFLTCVAWKKTAEFLSTYFHRGDMATVCGSLETRKFEDKNGNSRTMYEIRVENIYFAGSKPKDGETQPPTLQDYEEINEDGLPF